MKKFRVCVTLREIEVTLSFWCDKCQTRIFPDTTPNPFGIPSIPDLVEQGIVSVGEMQDALRRNHMRKHQEELCHV